jgi:hypothetical protein
MTISQKRERTLGSSEAVLNSRRQADPIALLKNDVAGVQIAFEDVQFFARWMIVWLHNRSRLETDESRAVTAIVEFSDFDPFGLARPPLSAPCHC